MSESPVPRDEVRKSPADERAESIPAQDSPVDDRRGRSRSVSGSRDRDTERRRSPQDRRERDRSSRDDGSNGNVVYVAKLSRNTRESDLRDSFGRFGTIKNIVLKQSFAFITFEKPESATEAIARMNGAKFVNDEELLVEQSGTSL